MAHPSWNMRANRSRIAHTSSYSKLQPVWSGWKCELTTNTGLSVRKSVTSLMSPMFMPVS